MATRDQVLERLRRGESYEEVGAGLGIPPGQAYLVATGLPADGGDTLAPEDTGREGMIPTSTQHLANPPSSHNPTKKEHVLSWVRDRASADAQMAAAAARRDAEPATPREADATSEVTTVLTRDHNQVKAMLEQLETIPGVLQGGSPVQTSRRKSIVDMITVALSAHEAVEEQYLWPAVRRALPEGEQRAERALAQEQEGKDTLAALGKESGDSEEFDRLVEELVLRLRQHVAFEDQVFLELRAAMTIEDREKLGAKLSSRKAAAPTRPHPHAPSNPTALKVAGPGAAVSDKVRDAVGDRPAQRRGKD